MVFVDEAGGWLGLTRLYARIVGGARIEDTAPKRRKGKVSLIAAVSTQGMNPRACLVFDRSVDRAAFLTYIEHSLVPTLKAGQIVIMDNFTIHHNHKVRELIEDAECELLYLPTYSLTSILSSISSLRSKPGSKSNAPTPYLSSSKPLKTLCLQLLKTTLKTPLNIAAICLNESWKCYF